MQVVLCWYPSPKDWAPATRNMTFPNIEEGGLSDIGARRLYSYIVDAYVGAMISLKRLYTIAVIA